VNNVILAFWPDLLNDFGIYSKIFDLLKEHAMVHVEVDAGICGFKTDVQVSSDDNQKAHVKIQSGCTDIMALAEELKDIDCFAEVFSKLGTSPLYLAAQKHCKHAACPVPMAILKGLEVECGLALPKDVKVKITKMEQ
jgi:hypothetical protein